MIPQFPLQFKVIPVTPFRQNCTILWSEKNKKGVVVDPGGEVDLIVKTLEEHEITLQNILLTHGHVDHAAGATDLQAATDAPIVGPHQEDDWLLHNLDEIGANYRIHARAVYPDRWLQEGDSVAIGDFMFEVLHCPGHSPGHVVFVNRGLKFGLFGDVLFRGSVGRTDFPRGDHLTLMRSIRYKLFPLGDDFTFFCGHGPSSTLGYEKKNNPFLQKMDV